MMLCMGVNPPMRARYVHAGCKGERYVKISWVCARRVAPPVPAERLQGTRRARFTWHALYLGGEYPNTQASLDG